MVWRVSDWVNMSPSRRFKPSKPSKPSKRFHGPSKSSKPSKRFHGPAKPLKPSKPSKPSKRFHGPSKSKPPKRVRVRGGRLGVLNLSKSPLLARSERIRLKSRFATATTVVEEVPGRPKAVLSVVIPYYRAGFIGWVPFESLIRQEGVNFNWELIILEEGFDNPFGYKRMVAYWDRLKAVGCCRLKYIQLKQWLPLSGKWYYLIQSIDTNSQVVCFNSADIYMSHKRLAAQFKILSKPEYNWYKLNGNLVYDIGSDSHVALRSLARGRADTCCRAAKSGLVKKLPLVWKKRSVDTWMFKALRGRAGNRIRFYYDQNGLEKDTVNITGLNNISHKRAARVRQVAPPFRKCCASLESHIPLSVVKRLRRSRN
ncbi:hypothetical protein LCGC14_2617860, partial [marine sediment metagenome]